MRNGDARAGASRVAGRDCDQFTQGRWQRQGADWLRARRPAATRGADAAVTVAVPLCPCDRLRVARAEHPAHDAQPIVDVVHHVAGTPWEPGGIGRYRVQTRRGCHGGGDEGRWVAVRSWSGAHDHLMRVALIVEQHSTRTVAGIGAITSGQEPWGSFTKAASIAAGRSSPCSCIEGLVSSVGGRVAVREELGGGPPPARAPPQRLGGDPPVR